MFLTNLALLNILVALYNTMHVQSFMLLILQEYNSLGSHNLPYECNTLLYAHNLFFHI